MAALLCLFGSEGRSFAQSEGIPEAEQLNAALRSGNSEAKREALFRIRNLRSAEASRIAVQSLRDRDEIVRATAAMSVVFLPPPEAVGALVPLLDDRSPFVRREAAYALGAVGSDLASARLVGMMQRQRDVEVRSAAAVALGTAGETAAAESLAAVLNERPNEENEFLRRASARSIGQIAERANGLPPSELTPENFLPDQFKSAAADDIEDLAVRYPFFGAVLETLRRVAISRNETFDTRREAAFAIGAIGSETSVSLLETLAKSEDPYLAEISREALLRLQKPR